MRWSNADFHIYLLLQLRKASSKGKCKLKWMAWLLSYCRVIMWQLAEGATCNPSPQPDHATAPALSPLDCSGFQAWEVGRGLSKRLMVQESQMDNEHSTLASQTSQHFSKCSGSLKAIIWIHFNAVTQINLHGVFQIGLCNCHKFMLYFKRLQNLTSPIHSSL